MSLGARLGKRCTKVLCAVCCMVLYCGAVQCCAVLCCACLPACLPAYLPAFGGGEGGVVLRALRRREKERRDVSSEGPPRYVVQIRWKFGEGGRGGQMEKGEYCTVLYCTYDGRMQVQ